MSDAKKVRLREFAGLVNRASEIVVPVSFSSHTDAAGEEDGVAWLPIQKNVAKQLIDEAKEIGVEEIEGVFYNEEEGCLYIEGPGDDEIPAEEP